ncbi:accessory secretory system protein Asp4 [Streptococcus infantis]|jgi:conserved domain protein|uniref:accessory Sec system protein Asp4 n=1 Tax=Streptococcus infantis TaxID=68892 RepID=UPI0039C232A5
MAKKDLFYQDVEGRMEEMKQQPIKKEKSTRGEKISKTFSFLIGFIILIGLLFTLIRLLR